MAILLWDILLQDVAWGMNSLHSPEYRRFLRKLRQARIDAGLKQTEVAATLGVPQSWVSKCESGERRVDVVELKRLATLYKKKLEWFVGSQT